MLKISMAINLEFIGEVGTLRWVGRTLIRQFSKRVLRRDNTILLPTGLRMRLPRTSKFATEVFITQCHVDWGSEELFASNLDPSGVVLDVGSNIGYYSLYVLPLVSAVHAFEPDPRVLNALRSNLAGHSNAHVCRWAVGNRRGTVQFALEENSETSHVADILTDTGKELYEADITTIDDFVGDRRLSVTGIKIDVEGADNDVLEGALTTLGSQSPLMLTETKPDERLFELIDPFRYRVFAFIKYPKTARFAFQEIFRGDNLKTKMLFLVPTRLHSAFETFVTEQTRKSNVRG